MVSILLATYNGQKYIKQSIDSLLNQSFEQFEVIIGFNGTCDNSKEIVLDIKDPRLKIFDYDNEKGKAKTLNKLIKEANFDLVAIQDDDDIWHRDKLKKQLCYLNNYDVVGSFIDYIDESGRKIGAPSLAIYNNDINYLSLNGSNQVANTSAIFKRRDCVEIGGWREDIDGVEDYDFWIRLMRAGKTFLNIPEILVSHRIHSKSNFNSKKQDISKLLNIN